MKGTSLALAWSPSTGVHRANAAECSGDRGAKPNESGRQRLCVRAILAIAAWVTFAGCLSTPNSPSVADLGASLGVAVAPEFSAPVQVNAGRVEGYEPSLRIGPDGTVYVAAARGFLAGAAGSLSSPVWFSRDNGSKWAPLPSGPMPRDQVKAFEGDLAIDGRGMVYFVDTYLADNVITTWGPDQTWRRTSPLQGTTNLDDRPWLAAHGSGILYYLGASVVDLPAPSRPTDLASASALWFYRSLDGGQTWTSGHAFTPADACHVAADPSGDQRVLVVCAGPRESGAPSPLTAFLSMDRGTTWTRSELGVVALPPNVFQPSFPVAAFAPTGEAYALSVDHATPGRLHLYAHDGSTWEEVAAPVLAVHGSRAWVAAGPEGQVAAAYYGREGNEWFLHAWLRSSSTANWSFWRDPTPVSSHATAPEDFFQIAFDPAGMLHIAYQSDAARGPVPYVKPDHQPVFHVRQIK